MGRVETALKKATAGVAIGCLGVIAMACLIIYGLYAGANREGWIPHSGRASVRYPAKGWEIGEYQSCAAGQGDRTSDVLLDCSSNSAGLEDRREMDATFWGQVRTEAKMFTCQRNSARIVCHLPSK